MNVSTFVENGITIHSASVEDVRKHLAPRITKKRAVGVCAGDIIAVDSAVYGIIAVGSTVYGNVVITAVNADGVESILTFGAVETVAVVA